MTAESIGGRGLDRTAGRPSCREAELGGGERDLAPSGSKRGSANGVRTEAEAAEAPSPRLLAASGLGQRATVRLDLESEGSEGTGQTLARGLELRLLERP